LYLLNQFDKELFFFGRRVDSKKKAGRETQSKAEEIFLAEIVLSEEKIKPVISVIDYVFDLGIFTKSKIFLLNKR
jgi:nitrogen regulatory protein PII